MAQKPNGNAHRRLPADSASSKRNSNGYIGPDTSRRFTKSSSDTFAITKPSPVIHQAKKNRSATCEEFSSFSGDVLQPSGDLGLMDDTEKPPGILKSDVTNENEDWSEESHTLGGSSDSAKTVKTEICLRTTKPGIRKAVHSWPESTDTAKSSASTNKLPSLSSFESSGSNKKRVRMKETAEQNASGKDKPSSSKNKMASSKDKASSSKDKAASSKEKATSSKERATSSERTVSRSGGKAKDRDVTLKLPQSAVHIPADKQIMPKSPSSGLTTPSEKTSEVTSPIQEAKKFLKGGTRAILIQKELGEFLQWYDNDEDDNHDAVEFLLGLRLCNRAVLCAYCQSISWRQPGQTDTDTVVKWKWCVWFQSSQ